MKPRSARRTFSTWAAVLLCVSCAAGCRPGSDGRKYMPLAAGSRWDYSVSTDSGPAGRRRLEVVERTSELTWKALEAGEEMYWSWEDDFLSVQRAGVRIYLLVLPASRGAGWWTVTPDGARVWCSVHRPVAVTVPAGTFRDCVEVLMEPVDGRSEIRHWFAPGVGWVRYSYGPRGGRPWMVRELVSWSLAPPDTAPEPARDRRTGDGTQPQQAPPPSPE